MNVSHFLGGHIQVNVTAPFPQRLLNLAAQENLIFWGLVWLDTTHITLKIPCQKYPLLVKLATQIGGEVAREQSFGLPNVLGRFRHRLGFVLGFTLSLLAVTFLSHFILVIDIEGNQNVDTATIRSALEKAGLHLGTYGPSLSLSHLPQVVLADLEGISWMSVNLYGTRAQVLVREATPPPVILPTEGLYDIVATTGGIIEEIQAYSGQKLVQVGDTVAEGQVLISGNVALEVPLYSEEPPLWLTVPSSGKVVARTWHSITAVMPRTAYVKTPYGKDKNAYEISFFGERMTFFENNMIFSQNYDKLRTSTSLPYLPDLPLTFVHVSESPYTLSPTEVNRQVSREILAEGLLETLQGELGDTGEILTTEFQVVEKDKLLQVTLLAECRQEIGTTIQGTLRQALPEESPSQEDTPPP